MKKSIYVMVFVAIIVAMANLSFTAFADCAACQGEQNWSATATSFLEGTPAPNVSAAAWGPRAERQKNSQFSSEANNVQNTPSNEVGTPENAATVPTVSIDLINASADPNPATSGSYVKISAILEDRSSLDSSGSQAGNGTPLTVVAAINNSTGDEVGKLSLPQSANNEYSGFWHAAVAAGIYKATITASSPQASETFKDALQIEVIG